MWKINTIKHNGSDVILILESRTEIFISLKEYRQKVYTFTDKVSVYQINHYYNYNKITTQYSEHIEILFICSVFLYHLNFICDSDSRK